MSFWMLLLCLLGILHLVSPFRISKIHSSIIKNHNNEKFGFESRIKYVVGDVNHRKSLLNQCLFVIKEETHDFANVGHIINDEDKNIILNKNETMIYKLYDITSGKVYIGSTETPLEKSLHTLKKRFLISQKNLQNGKNTTDKLNAFDIISNNNYAIEKLKIVNKSDLKYEKDLLIESYRNEIKDLK